MLSEAMREELIERNVAAVVRPPPIQRVDVQPWSTEEASRFLATTADHRLHALFAVGARWGYGRASCSPSAGMMSTSKVVCFMSGKTCSGCPR